MERWLCGGVGCMVGCIVGRGGVHGGVVIAMVMLNGGSQGRVTAQCSVEFLPPLTP